MNALRQQGWLQLKGETIISRKKVANDHGSGFVGEPAGCTLESRDWAALYFIHSHVLKNGCWEGGAYWDIKSYIISL